MRMAALSQASGVPVPTIKFYLREGLLPAGARTSPNQSQYSRAHVQRLELIRALTELGGLSLATVAQLLSAVDDPRLDLSSVWSMVPSRVTDADAGPGAILVEEIARERGWQQAASASHRRAAAELVSAMSRLRLERAVGSLRTYADAAQLVAEADLAARTRSTPAIAATSLDGGEVELRAAHVEQAVALSVLGEALFAVFRRMAQTALATEDAGSAGS